MLVALPLAPTLQNFNSFFCFFALPFITKLYSDLMNPGAMRKLDAMETSTVQVEKSRTYVDVYQYFLLVSLVAVLLYLGAVSIIRESA